MRKSALIALGMAAGLVSAITGYACADGGYSPSWHLAKDQYDGGGSGAMLTPGNDTRANLLLLLADRRGTPVRDAAARQDGPPLVLFPWAIMSAAAKPAAEPSDGSWTSPSRCQSNASGAVDFIAALRANRRVPNDEKARLEAARTQYVANCDGEGTPPEPSATTSPAGKAFESYLAAAADFYGGRFEAAMAGFAALTEAPDPWLRESALYMIARTELNRAQDSSFDEYGSLAEPEKREHAIIAAAGTAFAGYLQDYPSGRYASSARGLTRRVAWLSGSGDALAAAFDRQLARPGRFDGASNDPDLVSEIDLKLLADGNREAVRDPLLLAVIDLQRMRCEEIWDTPAADCKPRIGRAELESQAPIFARDRALFDYLRAAEAYFVRKQPRAVLALIPDAARQPRFTYLEFSRQMLRGLALQAAGDRNTRAFWLSLFPGAAQPYQREALELALAEYEERSGGLARIFAPESPVRHPVIRQMLLERVAGPDLLRQQARDAAAPRQERDVALYTLLAKELRSGLYRDFLGDVRMVPPDATGDNHYWSAFNYDARFNPELTPPPLGLFGPKAASSDAGCPALTVTVGQLAQAPAAIRPRLCLAEYFRSNGFDWFQDETEVTDGGLASSKPSFPGRPYQRLEVYKAIIADPRASDDDRALALNRAVRCYAPGGNNSCGGTEVPVAQRRAWYNRLKRDYPRSHWARSLKHYW